MKQLANYSTSLAANPPKISPQRLRFVAEHVSLLLGSFRKGEAENPEVYVSAITRIFDAYPEHVISFVTDPLTGLPGKTDWLPTPREVREACDARLTALSEATAREIEWRARADAGRRQIVERERAEAERVVRPSYAELLAKHGDGFGLKPSEDQDGKAVERRREWIIRGNEKLFARECEAAGVDPSTVAVSPELAAKLRNEMAEAAE